jgi:hypothetical protein
MRYDQHSWTFDCEPSLNDSQVLEFCRQGYVMLEGVVPDDINRRTCDYLEGKTAAAPTHVPAGMSAVDLERIRASHEPSGIFLEDWFRQNVLLNPQLAGVMRSLLGAKVGLPVLASHHGTQCPQPAQGWHQDADHVFGPELNFIEVFYFPQDTPVALGPTELVPGSHFGPHQSKLEESGVLCEGPAGTLGIHHQSILHRRSASTDEGLRHMLKYNYWRTVPPCRDWRHEADFDRRTAYYGGHNQARFAAHMFYWLHGEAERFNLVGGQAWPWSSPNQIGSSYGFDAAQGYKPDWRRQTPDGYAR